MLEKLLPYEREPFFFLNGSEYPLMDHFMWLFSNKLVWIPWIICLLFIISYKKNWKETILLILFVVLVITLCDQITSGLLKPLFHRFRPTHHPDFMNEVKTVFNYRGGLYGFASSHAANAFGVAMFTALLFKNRFFTFTIFVFAFMNGYSRIYLGVHFISDVVVGSLIGIFSGIICYKLYILVRKKLLKTSRAEPSSCFKIQEINIISSFFWLTVIILLLFNNQLVNVLI